MAYRRSWVVCLLLFCCSCLVPTSSAEAAERVVTLANGYSLRVPERAFTDLPVYRGKTEVARIALRKQMEGWLRNASVWGSSEQANSMLYMETQGAHFLPILQDLVGVRADTLLTILNWQDQAGSGTPVKAQHLVQILLGAHPTMKLIRVLPLGREFQYVLPPPRLFAYGGKLLLFTPVIDGSASKMGKGSLEIITPEGKVSSVLATFPGALYPTDFQKQHLLQLKDSGYEVAQPFWSYDLATKQLRHLPQRVDIPQQPRERSMTPVERFHAAARKNDLPTVERLLAQGIPADAEALVAACRREEALPLIRLLISKGAPVNAATSDGETPLFAAMEDYPSFGQQEPILKKLALLVENGVDIRQASHGITALEWAVIRRQDQVARFLLAHGADPNPQAKLGLTPLHVAALVDDGARVQALIQAGADVNAKDKGEATPLYLTAGVSAIHAAEALLAAGANPNLARKDNNFFSTPLDAAMRVAAPEEALLLVNHGANVRARGQYGESLLVMAMSMSEWQYRHRISDTDQPDKQKEREALLKEFQKQKDLLIETLLQKGADINTVGPNNNSPLAQALLERKIADQTNKKEEQSGKDGQAHDWLTDFLDRGADPNARFAGGGTVLFQAVDPRRRDLEIPLLLLKKGADINVADDEGVTPLMAAISQMDFQFANLLIDRGAKIAGHDRVHKTPLLWAAYYGQLDLVKLLLAKGANLHEQDDLGQTALTLARKGGHPEVVIYLQSLGLR